jgi:hypothetical protein
MLTCTTTVGLAAGHTDVTLWYVVHASRTRVLTADEAEFDAIRWFHFAEVPFECADPHMRRFMTKLSRPNRTPPSGR